MPHLSYPTLVLRDPVDLPRAALIGRERLLEAPSATLRFADFEAHADRAIAQAIVALETTHAAFEAPEERRGELSVGGVEVVDRPAPSLRLVDAQRRTLDTSRGTGHPQLGDVGAAVQQRRDDRRTG